jgi:hypothetical protein
MNIYQHHVRPLVAWLARVRPHHIFINMCAARVPGAHRAKRRHSDTAACYLQFIALGEHTDRRIGPAINIILLVRGVLLAFPNTAVDKKNTKKN